MLMCRKNITGVHCYFGNFKKKVPGGSETVLRGWYLEVQLLSLLYYVGYAIYGTLIVILIMCKNALDFVERGM